MSINDPNLPCICEGCSKPRFSRKMCSAHYQRWRSSQTNYGGRLRPFGSSLLNILRTQEGIDRYWAYWEQAR